MIAPEYSPGGRDSVAVRRVKMPYLVQLIQITGPLVSTSANRSGLAACMSRWQVMNQLGDLVDHVAKGRTQGYRNRVPPGYANRNCHQGLR